MKVFWLLKLMTFAAALSGIKANQASALCTILSASVAPLTASTGTYTPPNMPAAQPLDITVTGTFSAVLGNVAGGCMIAVSFNRTSLPATMGLTSGGSASMNYALQSSSSGGNVLMTTGAGIPSSSEALLLNFPAPLVGVSSFSVTGTVWAIALPVDPQQAGSYQDNIAVNVFSSTLLGVLQGQVSSQTFTVTGQVAKSCTIAGVSHPSPETANIPITPGGLVNTSPINKSFANVLCNTPSNLQLTSQNGAVTTASAVAGLQNLINYSALANFSAASASLDTATNPSAASSESGSPAPTSGSTPAGTLFVTITPQVNTVPLLAGSYADTLTISIVPQ
jgi:hypothetical protein